MRQAAVLVGLIVGVTALAGGAGARPAAATCAGKPATIVAKGPVVRGTSGDDVIVGTAGDDRIEARGGDDIVCAGAGDDTIRGAEGDDVIDAGAGDDRCLAGVGRATLSGCERVGTSRELALTAFVGSWDTTYSDAKVHRIAGPCSDRTPRFGRQGWTILVGLCGVGTPIGNTTPAPIGCEPAALQVSKGCSYIFADQAIVIAKGAAPGSFTFKASGGYPLPEELCERRRPGAWRIDVTGIDERGRVSEFRWRAGASLCEKIGSAPLEGWAVVATVTVSRVAGT